jgi:hypothetical protein
MCNIVIEKFSQIRQQRTGNHLVSNRDAQQLKDFSQHATCPHHHPLEPSIYVFYLDSTTDSIHACNVIVFAGTMLQNSQAVLFQ